MFERLFVMWRLSSFNHMSAAMVSFMTLLITSLVRHNSITYFVSKSKSSQSSSDMPSDILVLPCKALWSFYWANMAMTLHLHMEKLSFPMNLSILNLDSIFCHKLNEIDVSWFETSFPYATIITKSPKLMHIRKKFYPWYPIWRTKRSDINCWAQTLSNRSRYAQ